MATAPPPPVSINPPVKEVIAQLCREGRSLDVSQFLGVLRSMQIDSVAHSSVASVDTGALQRLSDTSSYMLVDTYILLSREAFFGPGATNTVLVTPEEVQELFEDVPFNWRTFLGQGATGRTRRAPSQAPSASSGRSSRYEQLPSGDDDEF